MTLKADQPSVHFYTTNYWPDPAVTPYMATVGKGGAYPFGPLTQAGRICLSRRGGTLRLTSVVVERG